MQENAGNSSPQSVHSGEGRGGPCGGVMDDGRLKSPIPPSPLIQTPIDVIENARKAQSLPGYYYQKPTSSPPQSFRQAFVYGNTPSSYGGGGGRSSDDSAFPKRQPQERKIDHERGKVSSQQEKKSSKRFLGGLFRRKKRSSSSSSSSSSTSESEDEEHRKRKFFSRKLKKKSTQSKGKLNNGENFAPSTEKDPIHLSVSPHTYGNQTTYLIATDTGKVLKMSPTGSLGRDVSNYYSIEGQPLGIPKSANLGRPGVSASHDSLAESAYGSINSSMRSSALGRSSSTDTLTKKEKREALKIRVERMRERNRGSSSDEELASASSSVFGSGSSLNKSDSLLRRSRSSRTERYIRRKSQELETLKAETEKDRKNREAVQARILEIQKIQKGKQKKFEKGYNSQDQWELYEKPKWSSQLIYRDSGAFDSSTGRHSSENSRIVAASPRPQYIVRNLADASNYRQSAPPPMTGAPISLESQYSHNVGHYSSPFSALQNRQRSISYESNINKASSLPPQYSNKNSAQLPNSGGLLPPAPPPRDRSSLLSPYEFHRPISYSFENLNQESTPSYHNTNGAINNRKTPPPPVRIDSSLSPLPPKTRESQLPPTAPCRRSFSERYLNHNDASQGYSSLPGRPALPKIYVPLETISNTQLNTSPPDQYTQRPQSRQNVCAPSVTENVSSKKLFVSSVPPSPSSDYSSYVSDNSVRVQQVNSAFMNSERDVKPLGLKSPPTVEPSRSSSPRVDHFTGYKLHMKEDPPNSRPHVLSVRQKENLSSFTTNRKEVSSPIANTERTEEESDSAENQVASKDVLKRVPSNRPLSMVAEKSESGEKDSPPTNCGNKPEPPKRNSSSITTCSRELLKQQFEASISKEDLKKAQIENKFREFFLRERERLEKSKCANFEEALQELEAIYKSLNLNSDDILEGAEKRDSCVEEGEGDLPIENNRSRSRTPRSRRPSTPDLTKDDLHYRRVQSNNRNQPDTKKTLQMTGSYLLVSPVHEPPPINPSILPVPQEPSTSKEPDVVTDDLTVRNVQRANSIKVIDPQPPFGIPLGPVTQGSRTDYLNAPPPSPDDYVIDKPSKIKEPDIITDDLAFRAFRKEGSNKMSPKKSLNLTELDEVVREPKHLPNAARSRSVPRSSSVDRVVPSQKNSETNVPRKLKNHHHRNKRSGKFYDSFKEALTDSEGGSSTLFNWRQNPSWIERANLSNNKWENVSTSTETLTNEVSSIKAVSQPDIRHAVIREARHPSGGPEKPKEESEDEEEAGDNPFKAMLSEPDLSAPQQLVRVHTISNIPVSKVVVTPEKKPYRPLDSIFNPKPKPFYLKTSGHEASGGERSPVDIAKLDNLISSLSEIDSKKHLSREEVESTQIEKDSKNESSLCVTEDPKDLQKPTSAREEAKDKIQNLIRSSMVRRHEGNNNNNINNNNDDNNNEDTPPELNSSSKLSKIGPPSPSLNLPYHSALPSPLVLSPPVAVMSTTITSKHFPTACGSPERVTVEECSASMRTDKVPTMLVSSEDLGKSHHSPPSSSILDSSTSSLPSCPHNADDVLPRRFPDPDESQQLCVAPPQLPVNDECQEQHVDPSLPLLVTSENSCDSSLPPPVSNDNLSLPSPATPPPPSPSLHTPKQPPLQSDESETPFLHEQAKEEEEERFSSSSSSSSSRSSGEPTTVVVASAFPSCVALYYPHEPPPPGWQRPLVTFCYVLACLVLVTGFETLLTAFILVLAVASLLVAFSPSNE